MKNMNNEIVRIFKCQCDGNIDENGEEIVEDLKTQNKVEEKLKEPNFYIVNAFKYLDADQQKSIGLKLIERAENGEEVREMPIISQDGEKTKSYEPCYLPKISGFIEDICSYIENAEILMPIEELVDENSNVVTRRQYGEVLIKYLVIDIRENFHNHIQNKVK
mgnify:FL=1